MITSPDNNLIKQTVKLKDKKYRNETGLFIIEGLRNVKDSIQLVRCEYVLISQSFFEKFGNEYNAEVVLDRVFDKISSTENSQGIVMVAKKIENDPLCSDFCLFLDRIRDPGNFGTILRTAVACGVKTIYCNDCVDAYNEKVVRSSMSAIIKTNIVNTNENELLKLSSLGYDILCADMDGENIFSYQKSSDKICLIIGNEANGVSDVVKGLSSKVVSLPMIGMESLNAGVCAAVMMYQLKFNKI